MSFRQQTSSKEEADKKSEYEKGFEDLLGNSKFDKDAKTAREQETQQRRQEMDQEKSQHSEAKANFQKKKEQAFEDMLSGKKSTDDKTLQELFKDFYSQVKETSTKPYVNSAKSSINSFSSKLEKKRQQFKERSLKKEDPSKQEAAKEETEKNTDKAAEADINQEKEQQQ